METPTLAEHVSAVLICADFPEHDADTGGFTIAPGPSPAAVSVSYVGPHGFSSPRYSDPRPRLLLTQYAASLRQGGFDVAKAAHGEWLIVTRKEA